jgi:hypothetical protein
MHALPGPGDLWRLALIALIVPTVYGLAMGDADWLLAAFQSPSEALADPLDLILAVAAPMLIVWTAVQASYWFSFSRSASMLAAAVVCGVLIWPFVDARALIDEIYETYNRVRGSRILLWRERPDSMFEGALIGAFCALAWLGLEKLRAPKAA